MLSARFAHLKNGRILCRPLIFEAELFLDALRFLVSVVSVHENKSTKQIMLSQLFSHHDGGTNSREFCETGLLV